MRATIKTDSHNILAAAALLCGGLGCFSAGASAQESANAEPQLEEVIVTAERRAVDIQKTPVSVSALSADQLNNSTIQDTIDLQYRVTGFVFKTNTVLGQPYIRGVGSDIISAGADASVATFVDDVYQTRASASLQDFYDLDRIEVVKGPQSTLYGRNVTGGAVRLFSKRPQPQFGAEADLLVGNYDKVRVRGMINAPLVADRVLVRLSGMSTDRDGYTKNIVSGKRLDDEGLWSMRGQVLVKASDAVQLLFIGDYTKENSTRTLGNYPSTDCCVNLGILFGGIVPDDPREVTHDSPEFVHSISKGISGKITWDAGPVSFSSLSSYRRTGFNELLDLDGTNVPAVTNAPEETSKTFTQDFQLASSGEDRFSWITGLYYLREKAFQALDIQLPVFLAASQPSGSVDTKAYAAYGQGSYFVTDKFRVTAGIRYSHEKRSNDFAQTIIDPLGAVTGVPGTVNLANSDSDSWKSWTPKISLDYFATDKVLLYVSASKGFKAGGFNATAFQAPFDPEKLKAYEMGVKSSPWGGRMRLNAAAFYYDYKDIQLLSLLPNSPPGAFPIVINAAAATIKGLEVEASAQLTAGFAADVGLTLLDPKFDDFISIDPNNPAGDPDRDGQRMPQAPKTSLNVGLQYTWDLADAGSLMMRGEWRYQSAIYFNTFADPFVRQSGYDLFNARIGYEAQGGRWYAALFGRNLADKLYAATKVRQDPLVGNLNIWGAPRTYGVEVGARF